MLFDRIKKLPNQPGCYLFKNKKNEIIYVGKAKSLKKRVNSYFQKNHADAKTQALVTEIAGIDFFITTNEVEALLLENNLIKKHQPKYNIDLKDSQRYAYILKTHEEFPRLLVARNKTEQGTYYGPFVSAEIRDQILKSLITTFQIRTCKRLPKKSCLRFHLRLCSAPCIKHVTKEFYLQNVSRAELFLSGKTADLIDMLTAQMKEASYQQRYEKAKLLRDQISALQSLPEHQVVERQKMYDEDVINYVHDDHKICILVFHIIKGILVTKDEFSFSLTPDFFEEFLVQYYTTHPVPQTIVLPHQPKDSAIHGYLEHVRNGQISLDVPTHGETLQLLQLVKRNIEVGPFAEQVMVSDLRNRLNLPGIPTVMECFDISHIAGQNVVGSMVSFHNGQPNKSNYRRFKIKTVKGIDDVAAIKEIVYRRYDRLVKEGAQLPDLIVIDGGKGQLSAALSALNELNVKIPIIALAKRFEEIYVPGSDTSIRLDKKVPALKLLMRIRDEAHRFAITYHRLLRSKALVRST